MEKQAAKLVQNFVNEVLYGDWEKLKTFDFQTLRTSEKYGSPGRNFDCDDTELMRAVYVVLWGDFLPELNMDNFGYRKQYRGDTINSFHTMFGRELTDAPGFFAGLEKYHPTDEFREKVRSFGKICSNIGNYAVLPNCFAEQTTLNCYRGTNDWHDFFDRFLIELHKVLTAADEQDTILHKLVSVNDFCLQKFNSKTGAEEFINDMFLDDYCDAAGMPQIIFPMNYHWKDEQNAEQYFHDAGVYLEKAEKIIRNRGKKIVGLLKAKVRETAGQY